MTDPEHPVVDEPFALTTSEATSTLSDSDMQRHMLGRASCKTLEREIMSGFENSMLIKTPAAYCKYLYPRRTIEIVFNEAFFGTWQDNVRSLSCEGQIVCTDNEKGTATQLFEHCTQFAEQDYVSALGWCHAALLRKLRSKVRDAMKKKFGDEWLTVVLEMQVTRRGCEVDSRQVKLRVRGYLDKEDALHVRKGCGVMRSVQKVDSETAGLPSIPPGRSSVSSLMSLASGPDLTRRSSVSVAETEESPEEDSAMSTNPPIGCQSCENLKREILTYLRVLHPDKHFSFVHNVAFDTSHGVSKENPRARTERRSTCEMIIMFHPNSQDPSCGISFWSAEHDIIEKDYTAVPYLAQAALLRELREKLTAQLENVHGGGWRAEVAARLVQAVSLSDAKASGAKVSGKEQKIKKYQVDDDKAHAGRSAIATKDIFEFRIEDLEDVNDLVNHILQDAKGLAQTVRALNDDLIVKAMGVRARTIGRVDSLKVKEDLKKLQAYMMHHQRDLESVSMNLQDMLDGEQGRDHKIPVEGSTAVQILKVVKVKVGQLNEAKAMMEKIRERSHKLVLVIFDMTIDGSLYHSLGLNGDMISHDHKLGFLESHLRRTIAENMED
ncbi:hypothetical protein K490DRAFT_58307 [Saccharata proteae CBS 121410]|uniref:Uncharacterized protein n=1 Tax=Saccharata proteae CBS 121410 TaxID=1314787 RepID=A0A9P4HSZ6_9PEZI|nr:hypothetical protein K490DRAFT_58307 [Saccharata proteae CBS 121410]